MQLQSRSRTVVGGAPSPFSRSAGTFGGGGGGGAPSRFSSSHLPRITGDVRFGIRRHRQNAALAEQSRPPIVRIRHAPEMAAVDVRQCRSAAPAARSGTCSRPSAGRRTLRSACSWSCDEQLRFALERLTQVVVEVGKTDSAFGATRAQVSQIQPLPGEIRDERRRPRIGAASACTCCFEHAPARFSWPRAARSSSSSSGMLLQRKNDSRDASVEIDQTIGRARRALAGSCSTRNRNFGDTSTASSPHSMPFSKSARRAGPPRMPPAAARCRSRSPAADRRAAPACSGSAARTPLLLRCVAGWQTKIRFAARRVARAPCRCTGPMIWMLLTAASIGYS